MIQVLFFAHLQDEIGENQVAMDIDSLTVKELKERIRETYAVSQMDSTMVSVNEEFAKDEQLIQRGDEVAFIPPISGG